MTIRDLLLHVSSDYFDLDTPLYLKTNNGTFVHLEINNEEITDIDFENASDDIYLQDAVILNVV